ncbi:MAG: flavodoxin [Bacteroidota bacterium]|nr:flavodoxin [Bacteroidota bacterium]MDP4204787.1 flavodoxin [Bacteroidota bacterium]
MKKTALIYSFNTINTAKAAKMIHEAFGDFPIDEINAETLTKDSFVPYENLILGVPTWFDGELPNYWDEFVPELEEMDLTGKKAAIFGLGDQKEYPENFCDGVGIMAKILIERGAELAGETQSEEYAYIHSLALYKGRFYGLLLDEENQSSLSNDRIKDWVKELKKAFI